MKKTSPDQRQLFDEAEEHSELDEGIEDGETQVSGHKRKKKKRPSIPVDYPVEDIVYDINDDLLNKHEEAEFCSKLEECIGDYDVVTVVDYGHGLITSKIVNILEEKSHYLNVNAQLNSFNMGYHTISRYKNVNYVCVHEGELRHDYRNRSDTVEHLVKRLSNRVKSNVIVVTQGTKGSLAFDNNEFITCPAFATNIVDRIGFIAHICSLSLFNVNVTITYSFF